MIRLTNARNARQGSQLSCALPELLRRLAEAFGQPDPEIDAAWRGEVRRRLEEIESGKLQGVPGEQVVEELRRIAGL